LAKADSSTQGKEKREGEERRLAREGNIVPNVDVLKIDKDCVVDSKWIQDYLRLILMVCGWFQLKVKSVKICRSIHKGLHLYVEIDPPVEANLANRIHWLLGDDCKRVDFNRARIESGLAEWSKLFERANVRLRTIYHASRFLQERKKKRMGGEGA